MNDDTCRRKRNLLPSALVAIFDRLRQARVESGKPTRQTFTWRTPKTGASDDLQVAVDFDHCRISINYWVGADPETQEALAHARKKEVLNLLDAEHRALVVQDSARAAAAKNSEKRKREHERMRLEFQRYRESNPGVTPWQFFHKTKHSFECTFPTFLKAIGHQPRS
jgi:hypothetical protein